MRTTRFRNNIDRGNSKSKDWKAMHFESNLPLHSSLKLLYNTNDCWYWSMIQSVSFKVISFIFLSYFRPFVLFSGYASLSLLCLISSLIFHFDTLLLYIIFLYHILIYYQATKILLLISTNRQCLDTDIVFKNIYY